MHEHSTPNDSNIIMKMMLKYLSVVFCCVDYEGAGHTQLDCHLFGGCSCFDFARQLARCMCLKHTHTT